MLKKGRIGVNSQFLVFWGRFRGAKKCQGAKMCSCSDRRDSRRRFVSFLNLIYRAPSICAIIAKLTLAEGWI